MQRVVAPMATHLCHLVLLCDGEGAPGASGQLEGAARAVAAATEGLAAAASRYGPASLGPRVRRQRTEALFRRCASETEDEELREEMSPLMESVAVSGQHVLLAAQKLSIQPARPEHKEELIAAAQGVFLGVVKVKYDFALRECVYRRVVTLLKQGRRGRRDLRALRNLRGRIAVLP